MFSGLRLQCNRLLDLLFPRYCAVCDEVLSESEQHLCIKCFMDMPRTYFHTMKENVMEKMYWGKIPIEQASALMYYKEGFKEPVHDLKYHKNHAIGEYLGRLMAEEIIASSDFFEGIDAIVPIPLHRFRKWRRRYNQSEYIAKGIHSVTEIPIYTDAVIRTVNNRSQTKMSFFERKKNVENIFKCTQPALLRDKHILLVDDVITSNSTTLACAEAIMQAVGAPFPYAGDTSTIRFSILSLAYAGK